MIVKNLSELPQAAVAPPGFIVDLKGIWKRYTDDEWQQVTYTPAWVAAIGYDSNDEDLTIQVDFINRKNGLRSCYVSFNELMGGVPLAQRLATLGLLVAPSAERVFRDYLAQSVQIVGIPTVRLVRQLGFTHLPTADGGRELAFILPDQVVRPASAPPLMEPVVFRPHIANPTFGAYHAKGTLEEAIELLAPLCEDPIYCFAICASLAGPFLGLAGVDNFIVNLYGPSSTGKTTLLQVGGCLWAAASDPQQGRARTVIERWNTTQNAIEIVSATHSGIFLCMDEVGANVDATINLYNVSGGKGKQRMSDSGGLRPQANWHLLVMSTGEVAMQAKNEAGSGQRSKTGETIRALDIPIADVATNGGRTAEEAGILARATKLRCGEVYGTIGPRFIQCVLDTFASEKDLRAALHNDMTECRERLCAAARAAGYCLQPPQVRAIGRLALLMAIGSWAAQVFPALFTEERVEQACVAVTLAWLANLPISEEEQIESRLRDYVLAQGAGVTRHKEWLLLDEAGLTRACPDMAPRDVARALATRGFLHREAQKLTSRHAVDGGERKPYYAIIARRLLSEEELATLAGCRT
ncbi:DUF927 domain-containing protein [uncultured Thiodictyon sp.]|uniref:DUF927 domain-containing protein n=1 Tax=uncultured Thiodictyon sp. TaxID=1846217 RepID=UPI0025D31CDD|nr:DUF927 domain-containing protein [uncultured Thiodictyon sp.]